MSEDAAIAKQWVAKAKNDLLNADNNLAAQSIPTDTVCFHCQQAAEKLFKGFLAGKGRRYPLTHDLLLLLENVLSEAPDAEALRDSLAVLQPYAIEVRYPDDLFMPTLEDAHEARSAAAAVLLWFEHALPEALQGNSNTQ